MSAPKAGAAPRHSWFHHPSFHLRIARPFPVNAAHPSRFVRHLATALLAPLALLLAAPATAQVPFLAPAYQPTRPVPAPATQPAGRNPAPAAQPARHGSSPAAPPASPDTTPSYLEEDGEARGRAVAAKRGIDLDLDDIRAAQTAALAEQARDDDSAWFAPDAFAFLPYLDTIHDRTFILLDNLIRILDLFWAIPGVDYHAELSSLSLTPMFRVGGRGDDGDFELKLKLRADTALPGLERRFHLIVDNAGRNTLPGTDPMTRKEDWRLGIKSAWDTWTGAEFDLGGGIRFHSKKPVGYGEASIEWEWALAEGDLRLIPSVYYYTDTHWGQDVHIAWQRWFGPDGRWGLELSSAEEHAEHSKAFEFENTVKIAYAQGLYKSRGWLLQASLFPTLPEGHDGLYLDDALVALSWKSAVYRRWLYATLTPQIDFADEDDHRPHFSFRAAFEILFGGKTHRLM